MERQLTGNAGYLVCRVLYRPIPSLTGGRMCGSPGRGRGRQRGEGKDTLPHIPLAQPDRGVLILDTRLTHHRPEDSANPDDDQQPQLDSAARSVKSVADSPSNPPLLPFPAVEIRKEIYLPPPPFQLPTNPPRHQDTNRTNTYSAMAAAIKAINTKIRSNKYTDYICSTRAPPPPPN